MEYLSAGHINEITGARWESHKICNIFYMDIFDY